MGCSAGFKWDTRNSKWDTRKRMESQARLRDNKEGLICCRCFWVAEKGCIYF